MVNMDLSKVEEGQHSKKKKYQLSLLESLMIKTLSELAKDYQNDLNTDSDLLEDEKFQINRFLFDIRELLVEVEKYLK